jgi:hypothetical protein
MGRPDQPTRSRSALLGPLPLSGRLGRQASRLGRQAACQAARLGRPLARRPPGALAPVSDFVEARTARGGGRSGSSIEAGSSDPIAGGRSLPKIWIDRIDSVMHFTLGRAYK